MRSFKTEFFKVSFDNLAKIVTIEKLHQRECGEYDDLFSVAEVARYIENVIRFQMSVKEAVKVMSKITEYFHTK
jgi:hypothetical protein